MKEIAPCEQQREHGKQAKIKLKMVKCTCTAYQKNKDLYYDAVKEGKLKLVSESDADYVQKAVLECLLCGAKWVFTRNDSYHYPIIEWKKI
ncbi:MAG: hypothetical protein Q8M29_13775 [Bacteroidota bacterium]|nr:hypothetical protein [Bacteroidota bacterium]